MSIAIGRRGEKIAAAFLQKKGLRIIANNYYCRRGEIDIIAEDGQMLVFVEVRCRRRLCDAAASVDVHKQRRLIVTAAHYLSGGSDERLCRFDVVLVDENNQVRWLRAAFNADNTVLA